MYFAQLREMRSARRYIVFAKAFLGKVFGKGCFCKKWLKIKGLGHMLLFPNSKSPKTKMFLGKSPKMKSFLGKFPKREMFLGSNLKKQKKEMHDAKERFQGKVRKEETPKV